MTTLDALADRVLNGGALNEEDAEAIARSTDLIAVGTMADEVRRQLHGNVTTFLRVFEVHVDAVPATLPSGVNAGEIRIIGQPRTLEAAAAAATAARALAGSTYLTGFSAGDIHALGGADGFRRLKDAGLDGIAELALDDPSSTPAVVGNVRAAGLDLLRLTVHRATADSVAIVRAAADLMRAAGGFRAFAPLARTISISSPTTGYDDVKLIALARLFVREIPTIQVDWALYGPKLAQVALTVGADDIDSVAAVDSGTLGRRRAPLEEIRNNIRAAGLEPVERDGRYAAVSVG